MGETQASLAFTCPKPTHHFFTLHPLLPISHSPSCSVQPWGGFPDKPPFSSPPTFSPTEVRSVLPLNLASHVHLASPAPFTTASFLVSPSPQPILHTVPEGAWENVNQIMIINQMHSCSISLNVFLPNLLTMVAVKPRALFWPHRFKPL